MIRIPIRALLIALSAIVVALLLWGIWFWQAERTVARAFASLVQQVEKRNWEGVQDRIAEDYKDRWGLDREEAIRLGSEALRQFFLLEIRPVDPVEIQEQDGGTWVVSSRLQIAGTGSAISAMIVDRANALSEPFVFSFDKQSWKPWDWKLIRMDQSQLEIPQGW